MARPDKQPEEIAPVQMPAVLRGLAQDRRGAFAREAEVDGALRSFDASAQVPINRTEAMRRLREHEAELRGLGVQRLFMFGSVARGEEHASSDVDLFFDHEKGKLGLFGLMEIKERASVILGRHADIMTRDSIHRLLRLKIEQSAVPVF